MSEEIKHPLEYSRYSCKVTWCPICKEHFYNERNREQTTIATEDHYHTIPAIEKPTIQSDMEKAANEMYPLDNPRKNMFHDNPAQTSKQKAFMEGYKAAQQVKPAMPWISIKYFRPDPDETLELRVLVLLDYTAWGRAKKRIEIASVHFTNERINYGGPNSLTGQGTLFGLYYAIPSICHPDVVTHWMPLPELPIQ